MVKDRCDGCRFYDEYEEVLKDGDEPCELVPDEGYGQCRRFPPVLRRPLQDDEDPGETSRTRRPVMHWTQPYTTGTDWCGEFQPANPRGWHYKPVGE